MSSESVYLAALTGLFPDTFHATVNVEWRKGRLHGFTRRHLRRRRHGVDCGISNPRPALSVVFWGLRSEASTLSSEGPVHPGCFATHRHSSPGILSTIYRCSSSPAGTFRSWSGNFAAQPQLTVFGRTQARKKPSVLPSPSNLTQTAPLAAADDYKRPRQVQTNSESFPFYMWAVDVDVLRAIQVYRFCEMCPRILNIPELC